MNILFSTFSYYPYNYGGTEVYISGLASFLQKQGHTVTIISGMPPKAFNEHPVFYEDDQLRTLKYVHKEVEIIGIILKDESITEFYRKYRQAWVTSWLSVLNQFSEKSFDILHLHGLTSPIGRALVEAVTQHSRNVKVAASYHVPVTCPKGTLLFANQNKLCSVPAGTSICTACSISDKKNILLPIAKFITLILPKKNIEGLPTAFRMKFLINEFVKSFHLIDDKIEFWFVFSQQIKHILLINGVSESKTILLRHGTNPIFNLIDNKSIKEKLNYKPTVFLYAGRFDKVKGFCTLLKAWSSLEEDPGRILKIIGETQSNNTSLISIIQQMSIRKDVEWLGVQPPESLAQIMKESHCVVIPSEWIEIGPLIFHEAIASGCDVIAADLGGCAELAEVYNLKTTLFKSGDAKELAHKITHFRYSGLAIPVNDQVNNFEGVNLSYHKMVNLTNEGN